MAVMQKLMAGYQPEDKSETKEKLMQVNQQIPRNN